MKKMWIAKQKAFEARQRAGNTRLLCAQRREQGIVGESEYRRVLRCLPYGIYTNPPDDADEVTVSFDGERMCIGTVQQTLPAGQNLQPGELLLCSAGGASVKLCNDGRILLNGKEV